MNWTISYGGAAATLALTKVTDQGWVGYALLALFFLLAGWLAMANTPHYSETALTSSYQNMVQLLQRRKEDDTEEENEAIPPV